MQIWTLKNGMTLVYERKPTSSVTLQVLVNVGSDHEPVQVRGISHFIEHMVFEGTTKRANARDIANEIERIGGELNAYTTNSRTCFYAKVLGKHVDIALDVLADILQQPLFRPEDVERQKNILFKEIDLVTDEPRFHQWILFQQTMFKKHPSRYPTYGSRDSVQRTTLRDILRHYRRYYQSRNMVIVVVGNVSNVKRRVEKLFCQEGSSPERVSFTEQFPTSIRIRKEKRDVANTYLVLGHRTVPRLHKDSYVLDIIDAILGRGQSGWMFDEIRNRHGLAYDVGTQHIAERDYGYFATYASVDKKNVDGVKKMILEQIGRLMRATVKDVQEAQAYLEGEFYLDHEDTQKSADEICFWAHKGDPREYLHYVQRINKITLQDVRRVAQHYFTKPYCFSVIEGKR